MKTNQNENSIYANSSVVYEVSPNVNNTWYFFVGLVILLLNKVRHELHGYKGTRGFSSNLYERAVAHSLSIVTRWGDYLKIYNKSDDETSIFEGKNILELGPGADLGVGLLLLSKKAKSYTAFDILNLVKSAPLGIYEHLFEYLVKNGANSSTIENLKLQLELAQGEHRERLSFQHSKDFDLSIFPEEHFDLVVSNSAFQQFIDPVKTISQLSKIVKPGGQFVALIDLKTHSRFIKTKDPLNIYRYPDSYYRPLKFIGSPNRMRPYEYENAFISYGWTNIWISPRLLLKTEYVQKVKHSLNEKFTDDINQMQNLTVMICATRL